MKRVLTNNRWTPVVAARAGEQRFARLLRPAQFAAIGAGCALAQLGLLALLTEGTPLGAWSNAAAFLLAAQLNFALNSFLTWRDRMHRQPRALLRQLAGFNALILVAVIFNQAIYLAAVALVPYLLAGAIGIAATTLAKYLIADRWIFPSRPLLNPETFPGA